MKVLLAMVVFLAVTTGCATHYRQIQGNTLVLYLNLPDAEQVFLACSLNDFILHRAWLIKNRWRVSLPSDKPFRYFYIIDGTVFVPPCQMKETDDFGSENCIFDPAP